MSNSWRMASASRIDCAIGGGILNGIGLVLCQSREWGLASRARMALRPRQFRSGGSLSLDHEPPKIKL